MIQSVAVRYKDEKHIDPLLSKEDWKEIIRNIGWKWENRHAWTSKNAWFIPTLEAVETLAKFLRGKKVLEVAAGTGFLAKHLRDRGVTDYKAVDLRQGHYTLKSSNYGVIYDDALKHITDAYDAIVMTWPSYDDSFGAEVVKCMSSGQILVYQGESRGGCCGDDEMFEILESDFVTLDKITDELYEHHVQFESIYDHWQVYKKI